MNGDVFKVIFRNQDKIYEVHARTVRQSSLFGFVEIEGMIFGENSDLLIDPTEEKLASEFSNVVFSHIPTQSIIRIDKVAKEGNNKILATTENDNVTPFPSHSLTPHK